MESLAENLSSCFPVEEYSEKSIGVRIRSDSHNLADLVDTSELKEQHLRYIDKLLHQGGPSQEDYPNIDAWMNGVYHRVKAGYIGPQHILSLRARFGDVFSSETLAGLALMKPHGYPGDYEIIDKIYQTSISRVPHLYKWDQFTQTLAAVQAVRNRKTYFHELLRCRHAAKQGRPLHVLNIASGPGRDMFEYLSTNGSREIYFDCVEQDQDAINYASALCYAFLDRITFVKGNILHFRPRKKYDIIWSAGLFDYFDNRVFRAVLKRLVPAIAPGGELVIGNFSDTNPSRCWMEFCDWILYHRSSKELLLLAKECGIPGSNLAIGQESNRVNLFLHIACAEHALIQPNQCRTLKSVDVEILERHYQINHKDVLLT